MVVQLKSPLHQRTTQHHLIAFLLIPVGFMAASGFFFYLAQVRPWIGLVVGAIFGTIVLAILLGYDAYHERTHHLLTSTNRQTTASQRLAQEYNLLRRAFLDLKSTGIFRRHHQTEQLQEKLVFPELQVHPQDALRSIQKTLRDSSLRQAAELDYIYASTYCTLIIEATPTGLYSNWRVRLVFPYSDRFSVDFTKLKVGVKCRDAEPSVERLEPFDKDGTATILGLPLLPLDMSYRTMLYGTLDEAKIQKAV